MEVRKIVVLRGLPASGKTTYAKDYCEKNPNTIRVNRDDIRQMFSIPYSAPLEIIVINTEKYIIEKALLSGYDIILDDTNLSESCNYLINSSLVNMLEISNIRLEVESIFMTTSVDICIERDSKRPKPVGKDVIMDMYNKYIK